MNELHSKTTVYQYQNLDLITSFLQRNPKTQEVKKQLLFLARCSYEH